MATDKQIEASRRNGAKSRGPVTPEGKYNSARANWKHGLLARTLLQEGESRDRFNDLYRSINQEFQPSNAIETFLIQRMVAAQWRQMRLWGASKDEISPDRSSVFENRFDRQYDRALAALIRLRASKKPSIPPTN